MKGKIIAGAIGNCVHVAGSEISSVNRHANMKVTRHDSWERLFR